MRASDARSDLAFVQTISESLAAQRSRYFESTPLLLYLLYRTTTGTLRSHSQAPLPLHGQVSSVNSDFICSLKA